MISCVICSRQPDISVELKENIASTIGCEYELVVIDNSKNEYSIFSAYNEGIRRANGDILCFMHEDILYHTSGWGPKVVDYFVQYPQAGLIGVAGTHYMPAMPAAWWDSEVVSEHYIQGFHEYGKYKTSMEYNDKYRKKITKVVSVDGFWMCLPKQIFTYIEWDEEYYKGFHGYDTDIALQVWKNKSEVHLYYNILIEHKSLGDAGLAFHNACEKVYDKWNSFLPMMQGVELSIEEQQCRDRLCELKWSLYKSQHQLASITKSNAYRLGKFILKPLSKIKRLFI